MKRNKNFLFKVCLALLISVLWLSFGKPALAGSISGTVTTMSGTPLPDIDIHVYDSSWNLLDWNDTDINGTYSLGGLTTGSYYVKTWDYWGIFFSDYAYISEYYDDVIIRSQATPVSVTEGLETPNIDFDLTLGGSISGTVVADADGSPISGAYLQAIGYNSNENIGINYFTINDGKYVIKSLPTGDYRVWAQAYGLIYETDYASEFYNDILDYQDATPVSVTAGTNIPDINFGLAAGGSISGTISYSGSTTGAISIGVFTASSYTPFWPTSMTEIFSPGSYSLAGVASGEWYVAALMDLNYNNTYDIGEPFGEYALNPVSVTAGTDTPNINIELNGTPWTNNPPVLEPIGDKTVNQGEHLAFVITATDPDGDPLSYSASNLPSNASFDPVTRTFSWTPGHDQAGFFHVWFTVSDGELGDIETIIITVNEVDEDGCSCGTISAGNPEPLKIEQGIGFFLPFLMVFLTIVILIKRAPMEF